jgi:GT2 family glycosyltransferase
MHISVIVCATRENTIAALVNSIQRQQYAHWELQILAQGKDPRFLSVMDRLEASDKRIRVIRFSELGKTKALNAGIQQAQGEVLAFTDDDCEADPNWLSVTAECFQSNPEVGILGGSVIAPPAPRFRLSTCPAVEVKEYLYRPSENGFQAPPFFYFIGANYAVRASAADRIGPFDEVLGPGGRYPSADEVDFCLRAEGLDIAMLTTPRSVVHHTYGRRSGIRQVFRHHWIYARGKGALIGKLELMNHRLGQEWGREPSVREKLLGLIKNPRRLLIEQAVARHVRAARKDYLENFTLGSNCTSIPLHPPGTGGTENTFRRN